MGGAKRFFRRPHILWGSLWRGFAISVALVLLFFAWCAWSVYRTGRNGLPQGYTGDAAVVLGAAAWDARPSPVFRERINHAVGLYRSGRVRKLVFTGGAVKKGYMSEGEVGRRYALKQGVPAEDILLENKSRTTYENLAYLRAPPPSPAIWGWTRKCRPPPPRATPKEAAVSNSSCAKPCCWRATTSGASAAR